MKKFRILSILAIMMAGLFSAKAQDVITLKSGEEIKAKVTEISATEVKYKRFDNLDGPTIVVEKAQVFAINYENGTREIINVITESIDKEQKETGDYNYNNLNYNLNPNKFHLGIFANPGGAVGTGVRVGVEFMKNRFISELCVGFPKSSVVYNLFWDSASKIIIAGAAFKYYHARQKGGLYVGPAIDYLHVDWSDGGKGNAIFVMGNIGYKFVTKFGLYFQTGAYVGMGIDLYDGDLYPMGILDLTIGFSFFK